MSLSSRCICLLFFSFAGCGPWNPADSAEYEPSRTEIGPLAIGVWLPAGLDAFRFGEADQQKLLDLGISQIEWLQRAVLDSATAEEVAMSFCDRTGLRMPVYYEPPGFSPYDKLRNWARAKPGEDFDEQVRRRVRRLLQKWGGSPGFWGYLVGHEDYRSAYYPALRRVVEILREEDPSRPAVSVGRIDHYQAADRFFDALFTGQGAPNVFQHEQYVFRADLPRSGKDLQRSLDRLVEGYDEVARRMQGRRGRWHAIVQVQSETRDGTLFYRKPTPAEIRVQVGLALSRGASGIVYFLYSSGTEEVRNRAGDLVETRFYEGLVDREGSPTPAYHAVRRIDAQLRRMSPALEKLHFHGGFSRRRWRENRLLARAGRDLEFGLFGDGVEATHLLVVNRRTTRARIVELLVKGKQVQDAVSGEELRVAQGRVQVELEAGGFRLLGIRP